MTAITIDHREIGLSRVALQYQESPRFLDYLRALLLYSVELEALFQFMATQVEIDIAEGVNLDVIGEIVGRSRIIPAAIPIGFFGFDGQPGVLTYGQEGVPGIGGRFRDESESAFASTVLADPEYRLLLKAKIIKNHSKGYTEDALAGLEMLFGAGGSVQTAVTSNGAMTMQIGVGRELQYWEKVIVGQIDILSRPAGVLLSQKVTWITANYFGFSDQAGALGFVEEGSAGCKFAEEF